MLGNIYNVNMVTLFVWVNKIYLHGITLERLPQKQSPEEVNEELAIGLGPF